MSSPRKPPGSSPDPEPLAQATRGTELEPTLAEEETVLTTQPVPGTAAADGVTPGRVLADRYEVRREIARGGMGAVYAAWDRVREEEIAIKVLHPHLFSVSQARVRFLEEAKTTSRLSHPCIVNVYDVQAEGPLVFLTMEMLQGKNLRDEIAYRDAERRPFTVEEMLDLARDLCNALSYAHDHLVHRDVKPENVFLCADGARKLMDFGIARLGGSSGMTMTGQVMGTLRYMAPEQHESTKDADHRADQYSLALVLYELLAGELPTPGSAPLHVVREDVPPGLSAAIDRALRPSPDERHADVAAFLAALSAGAPRPARRRPWPIAAAAGVVLLGAAAVLPLLGEEPADTTTRHDPGAGNEDRGERVEPREEPGDPAPTPTDAEATQASDTEPEGSTPLTGGDGGGGAPEVHDEDGFPPLHRAIRAGDAALVEKLLADGHSPTKPAEDTWATPLHIAAKQGHVEIVKALLAAGAELEAKDKKGQTPLHVAAFVGQAGTSAALAEGGADLEARDARIENTPLHYAATHGGLETTKALLPFYAEQGLVNVRNALGQNTPYGLARSKRLAEVAAFLAENGGIE